MRSAGHVLISADGELIAVDSGFCAIMQATDASMRGRTVDEVTAPADRAECSDAFRRLRETREPFEIVKRILRDDGSLLWVRNTVSITTAGGLPETIMATIEPVEEGGERSPAALLDCARFLLRAQEQRDGVCDPALMTDVAWSAMLALYVAEAEGTALDATALAARLDRAPAVVVRWVRALVHHGVLELETRKPLPDAPKMYRLTTDAHRRLETYLDRMQARWRAGAIALT